MKKHMKRLLFLLGHRRVTAVAAAFKATFGGRRGEPAGATSPVRARLWAGMFAAVCFAAAAAPGVRAQSGPVFYGYVLDRATVVLPAEDPTDPILGNAALVRLKGDFEPHPSLSFHFELSWQSVAGAAGTGFVSHALGIPTPTPVEAPALDHAWGLATLGPLDIQFGKLPLAWGTGYVFNPTARAVPPDGMGRVTEETPGVVALLTTLYLGDSAGISAYAAFQDRNHAEYWLPGSETFGNLPAGVRVKILAGPFDISAGALREVLSIPAGLPGAGWNRKWWATADLVGNLAGLNLYGEAALLLTDSGGSWAVGTDTWTISDALESTVGIWYFMPGSIATDLRIEYIHQGTGESSPDDYTILPIIAGERALRGEDYLFASLERTFADFHTVSIAGLVNLNDRSAAIVPEYSWEVYADFTLSLGAEIPFGDEGTEFDGRITNLEGQQVDPAKPTIGLQAKLSF